MGVVSELSTFVQDTIDSQRLIQLTSTDSTATSIDTDRLNAACQRAIGLFEGRTKILSDTTTPNHWHVTILIEGVMWWLENARGRDVGMTELHKKNFYSMCKEVEEGKYIPAETSSNLKKVTVKADTRQDMDRNRRVFAGRRSVRVNEINEEGD